MKFADIEEEYCRQVQTILKKFAYKQNNTETRKSIETAVADHFYDFMKSHNVNVYSNAFICDESNNTQQSIDKNELYLTVSIKENKDILIRNIIFYMHSSIETWQEVLNQENKIQ